MLAWYWHQSIFETFCWTQILSVYHIFRESRFPFCVHFIESPYGSLSSLFPLNKPLFLGTVGHFPAHWNAKLPPSLSWYIYGFLSDSSRWVKVPVQGNWSPFSWNWNCMDEWNAGISKLRQFVEGAQRFQISKNETFADFIWIFNIILYI